MQEPARRRTRIEAIDLARGGALVAMAIYHFTWDLEFFGYAVSGTTAETGWKLFARAIASSFLFLAGVSLYLAHSNGIRWRGFLSRLAMVAGAALAISAATYFATPDSFIFFGILHEIALASLLGLAFLRFPALVTLAAAAAVIAAPHFLRSPIFDNPAWWWTGLSSVNPRSNDYVPVFPWFGAVLIGMATAKLAAGAGLLDRLGRWEPGRWSDPAQFAGRHSLAVYLIHQPVLIGILWAFAQLYPAAAEAPEAQFLQACQAQCRLGNDDGFCMRYCVCVLDRLEEENMLEAVFSGSQSAAAQSAVGAIAAQCTRQVEGLQGEGFDD